ncbi:DUF5724 domain-containing protein [Anaerosporobacter sp.]
MGYDGKLIKSIEEQYKKSWDKKRNLRIKLLSKDKKALVDEIKDYSIYREERPTMKKIEKEYPENVTLSKYIRNGFNDVTALFVPKEYCGDYYYIIDKFNAFQYTDGYNRRTVRTKDYRLSIVKAFRLLFSYMAFGIFNCTLADYLQNKISPELLEYKQNNGYSKKISIYDLDCIIAARIDAGDPLVKQAIVDCIMSENNTAVVTTEIIRGIVKSSDKELHQLLCDFLLAAKLQEGVRQAICENADCGTIEAFISILDTIYNNNLIRYSAVKRAVAVWTGICSQENMDRISIKILDDILVAIKNKEQAYAFTQTNDSIHIMIGLWALGCYEVKDAIKVMEEYVNNGTRNQVLTMSYYNREIKNDEFTAITSRKIIEKYTEDFEVIAAFMPTYLKHTDTYVRRVSSQQEGTYLTVPITYLYEDEQQASRHFAIMDQIYRAMPKKKMVFAPCIFPWYEVVLTKTDLVIRMAIIAYALDDNGRIDYLCEELQNIDPSNYYINRGSYIAMLLHNPKTAVQRKALFDYVANRESYTRDTAFKLVKKLVRTEEDNILLESYLKYKHQDIRRYVLELLGEVTEENLVHCVKRLLNTDNEQMRLGGLDLIVSAKLKNASQDTLKQLITLAEHMESPTPKESILIEEIAGRGKTGEILNSKGYGIYKPDTLVKLPTKKADLSVIHNYFDKSGETVYMIFIQLDKFIAAHSDMEYKASSGQEVLLGYRVLLQTTYKDVPEHEHYPFPELWREFYEQNIKSNNMVISMGIALEAQHLKIENDSQYFEYEEKILGGFCKEYDLLGGMNAKNTYLLQKPNYVITRILKSMYQIEIPYEVSENALVYLANDIPENALWYKTIKNDVPGHYYSGEPDEIALVDNPRFRLILNRIREWKNEDEFIKSFNVLYRIDQRYRFSSHDKKAEDGGRRHHYTKLNMFWYIKAYILGLISNDIVYKAAFEEIGLCEAIDQLSLFMKDSLSRYDKNRLERMYEEFIAKEDFYKAGKEFYKTIIDKVLDVELKRGDTKTVFSESIRYINKIYGIDRLVAILVAMGNDIFDRQCYYGTFGTGKKECLSHLLQVCYPMESDTAKKLGSALISTGINENRLIETAMYAPQWISIIEEYLGYEGFKSGCYYFMAHMNERFDDKKISMIAKYTPLTTEELNDGAFDGTWFHEVYNQLGEKIFNKLYQSAKYISNGNKHARARKYSDAALGKIGVNQLETLILNNRNKDLLMSYGLVPITNKEDMLHRYEFLQKFLKECKQFGAQRRASETRAVDMALKNLATTAGYADVTRLTLAMETELVKANAAYLEWCQVEDYQFKVSIDQDGHTQLLVKKKDKTLKSIPSTLKKEDRVIEIKEFQKKLKDQYSRTVAMFEQAMENGDDFTFGELQNLCENPVTQAIVSRLVYKADEVLGFLGERGLYEIKNKESEGDNLKQLKGISEENLEDRKLEHIFEQDKKVRVAHPYDFYLSGKWNVYQISLYDQYREKSIKQPFKQVFRELYVKLDEELDKYSSRMFAGNQIQPQKAAACLKGRRWIADYEEGLQKIYYKDNIVARIYALADWFSPSDVEAPTLEWVDFFDRKNFESMKISDVPDIVYSEVMRDVDLAVSAAHAGGVDPETSHSTVEMRKVIIAFNLELFKLNNVTFEKNHAIIKGSKAMYSIHLGSGVIHQRGGHQINVLPVHSQSRGKIFLPFIDEDPKTAEIMSKIIAFAEDKKIKDPYILSQIIMN